jgi:hypothetical protein
MKFLNYINETDESQYEEVYKMLIKDVNPSFFAAIKKTKEFIYRASKTPFSNLFTKKKMWLDRKPFDTPKKVHDEFNRIFMSLFGWPVRSGVFTTSLQNHLYGDPYIFFPIGSYKFVWSPDIDDFYDEYETARMKNYTLDVRSYIDKNLDKAINSTHEIIFNCKNYYLVKNEMELFLGSKIMV